MNNWFIASPSILNDHGLLAMPLCIIIASIACAFFKNPSLRWLLATLVIVGTVGLTLRASYLTLSIKRANNVTSKIVDVPFPDTLKENELRYTRKAFIECLEIRCRSKKEDLSADFNEYLIKRFCVQAVTDRAITSVDICLAPLGITTNSMKLESKFLKVAYDPTKNAKDVIDAYQEFVTNLPVRKADGYVMYPSPDVLRTLL